MKRQMTRRFLLGALASGAAGAALAGPPGRSLRPLARGTDLRRLAVMQAEDIVRRARLDGTVAFAVADAASGQVLEARQAGVGLPPASVAKTVTALYALDTLGPDHRFATRVLAAGPVKGGVLEGDLVLAGGGDPALDTDALAELAAGLKAAGLREVRGDLLVWGGALPFARTIDPIQPDHVGYNPAVSGLNLNFNRVHFGWTRKGGDYEVTMDARSARYRPEVRMARMRVEDRATPIYTYTDSEGRDEWTVARGALGEEGARWLPVRRPELYAGEVFQALAGEEGIRLGAPRAVQALPEGCAPLAARQSAPLRELLREMLKYSTNLVAEVVGLAATQARGGAVATLEGSAAAMNAWAMEVLKMRTPAFVDHSGLGDASRVSAGDLVTALVRAAEVQALRPILKDVPVRDDSRRVMADSPLQVQAKTGTLHFVSALAGYVGAPDGTELAFAILTADLDRRATLTRAELDRPEGSREWNRRARILQQALIRRWGTLYSG